MLVCDDCGSVKTESNTLPPLSPPPSPFFPKEQDVWADYHSSFKSVRYLTQEPKYVTVHDDECDKTKCQQKGSVEGCFFGCIPVPAGSSSPFSGMVKVEKANVWVATFEFKNTVLGETDYPNNCFKSYSREVKIYTLPKYYPASTDAEKTASLANLEKILKPMGVIPPCAFKYMLEFWFITGSRDVG